MNTTPISRSMVLLDNKESHWLQVSAAKKLGNQSGNTKMQNRKSEHQHKILHIQISLLLSV